MNGRADRLVLLHAQLQLPRADNGVTVSMSAGRDVLVLQFQEPSPTARRRLDNDRLEYRISLMNRVSDLRLAESMSTYDADRRGNMDMINGFAPGDVEHMRRILSTNPRVTIDLPQFGRQVFDVSGFSGTLDPLRNCVSATSQRG